MCTKWILEEYSNQMHVGAKVHYKQILGVNKLDVEGHGRSLLREKNAKKLTH